MRGWDLQAFGLITLAGGLEGEEGRKEFWLTVWFLADMLLLTQMEGWRRVFDGVDGAGISVSGGDRYLGVAKYLHLIYGRSGTRDLTP